MTGEIVYGINLSREMKSVKTVMREMQFKV